MVRSLTRIEQQCSQILRMDHTHALIQLKKLICTYLLYNDKEALEYIKKHVGDGLYAYAINEIKELLV